ncbi:hypothetical protein VTJ04DRAFT_10707 [Mycothermus thermophilus]|uniref:uncharacterized protein n=1 Tax=Humicola insolens TaxID=85995 RepID=UPI0037420791
MASNESWQLRDMCRVGWSSDRYWLSDVSNDVDLLVLIHMCPRVEDGFEDAKACDRDLASNGSPRPAAITSIKHSETRVHLLPRPIGFFPLPSLLQVRTQRVESGRQELECEIEQGSGSGRAKQGIRRLQDPGQKQIESDTQKARACNGAHLARCDLHAVEPPGPGSLICDKL